MTLRVNPHRPFTQTVETLPHLISCNAPVGSGGLGRHLFQMVEDIRERGLLRAYYSPAPSPADSDGIEVKDSLLPYLLKYTPARLSWARAARLGSERFDRAVASRLPPDGPGIFVGFVGQALHSFVRARKLGHRLGLVAANSHVDNVLSRHAAALREYPIEVSWLDNTLADKTRAEYEQADVIYANSDYTKMSLISGGIPAAKIVRQYLTPHERYQPPATRVDDGIFRIVFVGSISVMKGVPWLIEAFRRLTLSRCELILVGGWTSRGMRKYMQAQMQRDPRIRVMPGDPLPHLQRADVCVHPTFEDGLAYGPLEALFCGVPVIASEDTGMKEWISPGINGYVVKTGDVDMLATHIALVANRALAQPVSPYPQSLCGTRSA